MTSPTPGPLTAAQRESWARDGFLVLPGFFDHDRVAASEAWLDRTWAERDRPDNPLTLDAHIGTGRERRVHLRDADDDMRHERYKLNDAYLADAFTRDLVLDPALTAILSALIDGTPAVCNSLHFERGSGQPLHFDTFYMPPPPGGQLVVTSICFEDVHPAAGPLTYVPGSHLIPPFLNVDGGRQARDTAEHDAANAHARAEIAARGLEQVDFHGRAGDVFIWHEQLYHGGRPIDDLARTRRSLVTHYWRAAELTGFELAPWGGGCYIVRDHQPVPAHR